MARKSPGHSFSPKVGRLLRESVYLLLIGIALYLIMILVTYDRNDAGWSHSGIFNEVQMQVDTQAHGCQIYYYIYLVYPLGGGLLSFFRPLLGAIGESIVAVFSTNNRWRYRLVVFCCFWRRAVDWNLYVFTRLTLRFH